MIVFNKRSITQPPKSVGARSIDHPSYYNTGKIEVIDFIEDKELGFHLGNVVKYIARAGKKRSAAMSDSDKELQDLKKAEWYLHRYIEYMEERNGEKN